VLLLIRLLLLLLSRLLLLLLLLLLLPLLLGSRGFGNPHTARAGIRTEACIVVMQG
jgi:hypothetical protein